VGAILDNRRMAKQLTSPGKTFTPSSFGVALG
jgi:hypothetical protein